MPNEIVLQPRPLTYKADELAKWRAGDRADCLDRYCRHLPGTSGFGEYVVGRYFERQGYRWIHHDFDLFGLNKPGKYPVAEAVLGAALGAAGVDARRLVKSLFAPFAEARHVGIEQPDLLIYHPDNPKDICFAESKRVDTRDRLNRRQILGFMMIEMLFRVPCTLFVVCAEDKSVNIVPERWPLV